MLTAETVVTCRSCGRQNRVRAFDPQRQVLRCGHCGRAIRRTPAVFLLLARARARAAIETVFRWLRGRQNRERAAVAALALLATLPALFPPWTGSFKYGSARYERPRQRSFLFTPPMEYDGKALLTSVRLDLARLLVEEAVAVGTAVGLVYALRRRR